MEAFEFNLKTHTIFGEKKALELPKYLLEDKHKDITLVMDKNVFTTEYGSQVVGELDSYFPSRLLILYADKEPTYRLLDKTMQENREFFGHVDAFVAIGGGSVIDFAKGLATLTTNYGDALSYRGFPKNLKQPIPVFALPTTAGSGSDVTYNAVFIDTETKKKLGINSLLNFPKLAILDPHLVQTCPRSTLVSSGMDALTHAIEGYGATKSNLITRSFSESAIDILLQNLPSIGDHTNIKVLGRLMQGAWLAGAGLMNSGSGPAGAMSYILGTHFNVPHGLASAVFLPHLVAFNVDHGFEYHIPILADIVFDLCNMLDVPYANLKSLGVDTDAKLNILLNGIESLQPAFDQNPIPLTVEDAKKIVRSMI